VNTCTTCRHGLTPDRATWTTCQSCQTRITRHLDDIAIAWPKLSECLEPARRGTGPRVSGTATWRPPAAEEILDLVGPAGIPTRLHWQYAQVCLARGLVPQRAAPGSDTRVAQALRGIRRHLSWAVQAVDLADVERELAAIAGQLTNVTGGADDTPTVPCPAQLEAGGACTGRLRYDREQHTAACRTCRTVLDPAEWLGHWVKLNAAA